MSYAFQGHPSVGRSYRAVRGIFGPVGATTLLSRDVADEAGFGEEANGWGDLPPWEAIARLELRRYTHDQLLRDSDAMSMAHSLEVRVPLLDERLVECVLNIPAAQRSDGSESKSLLRAAVDDLLPSIVRERTRKQGFTFPFDVWLRAPLARWLADAMESAANNTSIFRRGAVERLNNDYQAGRVHWSRVWAVAVLEMWLGQERRAVSVPT
jgi:asparagine synthase (glutamine-hydrolysing)